MAYCTAADIQAIISIEGHDAWADDDESGSLSATETGYVTFQIDRAASVIDAYLVKRYDLSDLTGSNFLRFANAVMASKYVMSRRGEAPPEGLMADYDEFIQLLIDIKDNTKDLPDVIDSFNHLPTVTNFWTQLYSAANPVRVIDEESTGEADWQGQKKRSIYPRIFTWH